MQYVTVMPSWVLDEIAKGNKVYALDKESQVVFDVSDMRTSKTVAMLECAKANLDRFVFWYEKEEKGENSK